MIKDLYVKYKEFILYIIFGILTTILNYGCYFLFSRVLAIYYITSNFISWVITVIFAFIVNKCFVFFSPNRHLKTVARELILFVAVRITSLFAEMVVLYSMVDILLINDMIAKLMAFIIVILLNYFISKLLIFKK